MEAKPKAALSPPIRRPAPWREQPVNDQHLYFVHTLRIFALPNATLVRKLGVDKPDSARGLAKIYSQRLFFHTTNPPELAARHVD